MLHKTFRNILLSFTVLIPFLRYSVSLGDPPQVECLESAMRLHFAPSAENATNSLEDAARPFRGHIYVKGFFFSSRCHLDFTHVAAVDQPFYFHIPYRSDCQVRRERVSNESVPDSEEGSTIASGFRYSTVIIVQHHRLFVTEHDRAYSVSCFYREDRNYLQNSIQIGDLTPSRVAGAERAPSCSYEILSATTHRTTRFANIGDQLVHRWTCDAEDMGLLVHSCFVRDGVGSEFALLDERGCVTDDSLMEPLVYSTALNESHSPPTAAFKFADQMVVYFSCQITLCELRENGCEGITPPTCDMSSTSSTLSPASTVPPLQLVGGRNGPLGPISPSQDSAAQFHNGLWNSDNNYRPYNSYESIHAMLPPSPSSPVWRDGVARDLFDLHIADYGNRVQLRPPPPREETNAEENTVIGRVADEWAAGDDAPLNLFARGRKFARQFNAPSINATIMARQRRDDTAPVYFARTTTIRRDLQANDRDRNVPAANNSRITVGVTADRLIIFTNDEKLPSPDDEATAAENEALRERDYSASARKCARGDATAALWISAILTLLLTAVVCTFVGLHVHHRKELLKLRQQLRFEQQYNNRNARVAPGFGSGIGGFGPPPFFELATMSQRENASRQNLVG